MNTFWTGAINGLLAVVVYKLIDRWLPARIKRLKRFLLILGIIVLITVIVCLILKYVFGIKEIYS